MKVDHYTVPDAVTQECPAAPEPDVEAWFLSAIAEEKDRAKRQMLMKAATLLERLSDEVRAYRDAVELDPARPRSMRFRGWNMGKLARARRLTEAALGSGDVPARR